MPYKDKEKRRAFDRKYYRENRDKILKRKKDWRKKNPEKIAARFRRYEKTLRQRVLKGWVVNVQFVVAKMLYISMRRKEENMFTVTEGYG